MQNLEKRYRAGRGRKVLEPICVSISLTGHRRYRAPDAGSRGFVPSGALLATEGVSRTGEDACIEH